MHCWKGELIKTTTTTTKKETYESCRARYIAQNKETMSNQNEEKMGNYIDSHYKKQLSRLRSKDSTLKELHLYWGETNGTICREILHLISTNNASKDDDNDNESTSKTSTTKSNFDGSDGGVGGGGGDDNTDDDGHLRELYLHVLPAVPESEKEAAVKLIANMISLNPTLKLLELRGDAFDDHACQILADALFQNTFLKELILRNFGIEQDGAKCMARVIFQQNATLQKLTIRNHGNKGSAAAIINALLIHDQSLLPASASIASLETLNMHNNADAPITITDVVRRPNGTLKEVTFDSGYLSSDGYTAFAQALANNTTLHKLRLHQNGMDDKACIAISDALAQNTTLKVLHLDRNGIGTDGAKAMARALCQNQTLDKLDLDHNKLGDDGCIALSEALSKNNHLSFLNLDRNGIGTEGAIAIASALKDNKHTRLKVLRLDYNAISDEGRIAIANALSTNQSIQTLSLFFGSSDSTLSCTAFASILQTTNHTLQQLDRIPFSLEEEIRYEIQKNLQWNKTLGPIKAEIQKTYLFPYDILLLLQSYSGSCYVEAMGRINQWYSSSSGSSGSGSGCWSVLYSFVRKRPNFFFKENKCPTRIYE